MHILIFEVFKVVKMTMFFWVVTLCRLVGFKETSVSTCESTWCQNPKEQHCHDNCIDNISFKNIKIHILILHKNTKK
jgi:hypothetical protein